MPEGPTASAQDRHRELRSKLLHPSLVFFQLIFVLVLPSAVTLLRVREGYTPPNFADDPSPLGYTYSLLLWIIPLAYLVLWFCLHTEYKIQRKAFGLTLAILLPLGVVLDLLFANSFFTFENSGAILGIEIPGRGGGVPIEEYIFYLSGFLFVLLLYIWADEVWMDRYNKPHGHDDYQNAGGLLQFHAASVVIALVLLAAAWIFKKFVSGDPQGFPLYWAYLLGAALVPSAGFYRSTKDFINWRAFSFTFLLVTLVSVVWEASLASPYGWWGYQKDAMMGLFITAWNQLPVEAVFVWLVVTYTTVILYEVVTIWLASGKSLGAILFGGSEG
ncbi:MAG: hypothetical protein AAGD06_21340 [Acidobacteriota bacterium]